MPATVILWRASFIAEVVFMQCYSDFPNSVKKLLGKRVDYKPEVNPMLIVSTVAPIVLSSKERVSDQGAEWATVSEKIDTSTATGRMLRTFIALIAECERGIIAERTVVALGEKKRRRERLGTTPLGYKTIEGADGVKLVVEDSDEIHTVALIREWHAALHLNGRCWNQGINRRATLRRGSAWHKTLARPLSCYIK
jgi:hypothetical protein